MREDGTVQRIGAGVIVCMALLVILCAARGALEFAWDIGRCSDADKVRQDAVDRGFAEWINDNKGHTKWQWKKHDL